MMKAVRGGEVDVVIALTEGIVANMLQQNTGAPDDIVIIAPYVTSPLNWAIVTGADSPHTSLASLSSALLVASRSRAVCPAPGGRYRTSSLKSGDTVVSTGTAEYTDRLPLGWRRSVSPSST